MEQIVNTYYEDNAKKLHKMVDRILLEFGGFSNKDMDDFYSLANEVFVDVINRYDGIRSFDSFLYACLFNKFKSEFTKRNRERRKTDRMSVSIDTYISDDCQETWGDVIASSFDIEKEVFGGDEQCYSSKMVSYLSRLSRMQKEMLHLIVEGYLPGEIREQLNMSKKEYTECKEAIYSYRNVSLLY